MALFVKALKARVMTTELLINSNVSKKVLYESLKIAKDFERKYSAYKESSLLSTINQSAGIHPIECSVDDLEIFEEALKIAKLSEGKFDPSIGSLTQGLYGFGMGAGHLPSTKELQERKKLVNYKNIILTKNTIYLQLKGMRLDLGAIGKGYVADKIIQQLINRGASKALVSVGGDMCLFGKKYNIAIRDPFSKNNIAVIKSSKKALSISTSGDYERFIGSKENHHILNAKSAKQSHYYSSVTLIKNGLDATLLDGVSTIVFNSPKEELKNLAQKFSLAIIAITPQKEILFENFSHMDIESFEMYPFT